MRIYAHLFWISFCAACSSTNDQTEVSTKSALEVCKGATNDAAGANNQEAADAAEGDCKASGADATICDQQKFMTEAEALCVAEQLKIPEGEVPWSLSLVFVERLKRVIWDVKVTSEANQGEHYKIDATTGELLTKTLWSTTP